MISDKKIPVDINSNAVADYYPFGMSMPGRSFTSKNYRYGFNGKEKDDEVKDSSNEIDYGMRAYDSRLGRFMSIDPLISKLPSYSPYVFCLNNPISVIDFDGAFPYPIHIRSFAPYRTFGLGFSGDSRGYSTVLGKLYEGGTTTSRIQQKFIVDPSAGSHTSPQTWSDESHTFFGTKTGTPSGDITNFKSSTDKKGNSTVSFTANYAGNLPLIPSADIDVHTNFSITENAKAGTLSITAKQTGDQFPAAETFIGDTKGNQLFIGVSPAVGFEDKQSFGPYEKLPGDNNLPMMSNSFTVLIDKNGVFTGVKQGNKNYSIGQWNKLMQAKPTETQQEKPYPNR